MHYTITYSILEKLKDIFFNLIESNCDAEMWESYDNIYVFKMPKDNNSLNKISTMIKNKTEQLGYASTYLTQAGYESNTITNSVMIEYNKESNYYDPHIIINVTTDKYNTEKGYKFIAIDILYEING